MSEVKTIRLYGKLGAKFGRVHRMAVSNTGEAMIALASQHPGFEKYMIEGRDRGEGYACFIGKRNISENGLAEPVGNEEIRIAPILFGSKKQGWVQVLVGAIIFVIGWAITGFSLGTAAPVGTAIAMMGLSMMLGGVIQLLTPVPKSPKDRDGPDANSSYVFNGPVNTQAQGNPVPVLYGRLVVGSSVISAGIVANQQMAGMSFRGRNGATTLKPFGGDEWNDIDSYQDSIAPSI